MLVLIQVFIFALCLWLARNRYSGNNLKPRETEPNQLEATIYHKGKNQRRYIGYQANGGFPFIIVRERFYHRLLKWIGIAREIQTADAELDRKLYFITDYISCLKLGLQSEALRNDLKQLFEQPIKALYGDKEKLWCEISRKDLQRPSEDFTLHWKLLERIHEVLVAVDARELEQTDYRRYALLAMGFHSALAIASFFCLLPVLLIGDAAEIVNHKDWFYTSLWAAIVLCGLWFLMLLVFFRHTSWIGLLIGDFFLVGTAGFLMASGFITRAVNIYFDWSSPVHQTVSVLSKDCFLHCPSPKRGIDYSIWPNECTVQTRPHTKIQYTIRNAQCRNGDYVFKLNTSIWPTGVPLFRADLFTFVQAVNYHIQVQSNIYDMARDGDNVIIPVYPGALGMEWVDQGHMKYIATHPMP